MILLFDRFIMKLKRKYYKKIFLKQSGNEHSTGCLVDGRVEYKATNVKIGQNVHIYKNVTFWGDGEIMIGNNVDIGNDTIIFSSKNGGVYIGNDVSVAAHCYIIDSDHGIEKGIKINEQPLKSEEVTIGSDVWIADNCTVLKGSVIGKGAVIGAKSLVNSKIDEDSVAVGIPAKEIKKR